MRVKSLVLLAAVAMATNRLRAKHAENGDRGEPRFRHAGRQGDDGQGRLT